MITHKMCFRAKKLYTPVNPSLFTKWGVRWSTFLHEHVSMIIRVQSGWWRRVEMWQGLTVEETGSETEMFLYLFTCIQPFLLKFNKYLQIILV